MQSITVRFVDFWPSLDHDNNNFVNALRAKYDVHVIHDNEEGKPDILFYSKSGFAHYKYNDCVKVYYTGENDVPNFNECDYAMSFHHINFGKRHLRYPLYMLYEYQDAKNPPMLTDNQALERPFCSFLMGSHNKTRFRELLAETLEQYKPIAYGGAWHNNVGGLVDEKIPFIANYKFNLALENCRLAGYITEKILEPFAAATVPIYWGAPDVKQDFNPESFIDVNDYDSLESLTQAVRRIDNDADEYLRILRSPALITDRHVDFDARLSEFLCDIASRLERQVVRYGEMNRLHERDAILLPVSRSRRILQLIKMVRRN